MKVIIAGVTTSLVERLTEKCEAIQRLFELTSRLEIFELPAELNWKKETLNVPLVAKAGKLGTPIRSLTEIGFE